MLDEIEIENLITKINKHKRTYSTQPNPLIKSKISTRDNHNDYYSQDNTKKVKVKREKNNVYI
jgi:hypothetical protein